MNTFERDQELYRIISANYTGSQLARYLYAQAGTPDPQPEEPGEAPPPVEEPEEQDEGDEEEQEPAA